MTPDTDDEDEDLTPREHAETRRDDILDDLDALEAASQRNGRLENRANKELTPLSLLVSWLDDQVDEIHEDPFLEGEDEAEALRSPPSIEQQARVHPGVDFASVSITDLGDYKEALAEVFPGLDFGGSAASTLPQIQEVLEDHLAGRKTFWEDRAKKAAREAQSLAQSVESEREKLESFCRRNELPVGELVPDPDGLDQLPDGTDGDVVDVEAGA